MILKQVNYDDQEEIETVTVTMSVREAIALGNIAGQLNGHAHKKLGLEGEDSLYNCIAHVFNGQYDDGIPSLGISLDTLNLNDN